jgi:hypothetical protein
MAPGGVDLMRNRLSDVLLLALVALVLVYLFGYLLPVWLRDLFARLLCWLGCIIPGYDAPAWASCADGCGSAKGNAGTGADPDPCEGREGTMYFDGARWVDCRVSRTYGDPWDTGIFV